MPNELPPFTDADIELLTVQTKGIRLKLERGHLPVNKCSCIYGRGHKGAVVNKRDPDCPLHGRNVK